MNKVLIIDDEKTIRDVIANKLEKHGIAAVKAENYKNAMEIVRNNHFSLIFTDVMMPYTGGFEFIDSLKADDRTAKIPVILVTGMDKEILESSIHDAVAVVTKPFDVEDILQLAKQYCSAS